MEQVQVDQVGALVGANHWEINVRVGGRIAVAWKMFGRRQSAIFLHAAERTRSQIGATRSGSSPKDRVLMIGFPGLLFTSASGA